MWLFIFVGVFGCACVSGDNEVFFRKCCPRNQSLLKVSEVNISSEYYECLDRESVEKDYNITHSPLIVGASVLVEYGIPESCAELQMMQLSLEELDVHMSSEDDHCYDRLVVEVINGTVQHKIPKTVVLTCFHNKTENLTMNKLTVDHIRKCCPKGQSYDAKYHLCRHTNESSSVVWLMGRFNISSNSIYEVANDLHCKSDEYAVELSEDSYSLEVIGSGLQVLKKNGKAGGFASRGEWCVEREFDRQGILARVCTKNCSAFDAFCVRKCCPVGQHYKTRRCGSPISKCVPNENEVLFDISVYTDPLKNFIAEDALGIKSDLRCPTGKIMLNRSSDLDHHQLTRQGYLDSPMATNDDYCIEAFDSTHCPEGKIYITAVICFVKDPKNKDFRFSFVLITISSICLTLTLIVYCSLSELRNLHGRTLICHVSMMLLAFSCLARVQYDKVQDSKICTTLGYGIYFGFVAAFAWLNVMCLDIWWTFGSMRSVQPMRKAGTECKRFLWYSVYAWSIAIILTLTMFLLDRYPVARFLDANIGNGICWFASEQNSKTDWPHYIFFVIPMGLGTCTNFVLFMLTARHCARVKSEVHRLQAGSVGDRAKRRFRIDRAKYILTGKLWVVMGAGWVAELLSTLATHPQWLWNIVDLFNELQGVFIFLILIFKPKLYYLIRKRLGLEKPDAQKPSSSARTSSTFLSRTISADERATLRISQNNSKQP